MRRMGLRGWPESSLSGGKAWGQNAAMHSSSPTAAAVEEIVEGWLLDILDLPRQSGRSISFDETGVIDAWDCAPMSCW
jgi:hypothetical protein